MSEKTNGSLTTWNDNDQNSKALAFQSFSEASESYAGVSKAYHRDFLEKRSR